MENASLGSAGCALLVLMSNLAGGMAHFARAASVEQMPQERQIGRVDREAPIERPVSADGRPVLVPTTLQYEWIFRVPVASIEHRRIFFTAPEASTRSRRWNYEAPGLRSKRIKLWDAPEFSCKYPDVILPNECRTVWRGVYVDVPMLVSERAHVDIDVLRVGVTEKSFVVDIARWTWKEKRFRFSLPALAPPESLAPLRVSLKEQRNAVVAASDDAIATIDREIATVQASGENPAHLVSDEDLPIDLLAQRQWLLDQQAEELERLEALDRELSLLSARH